MKMSKGKQRSKNGQPMNKNSVILIGIIAVLVVGFFVFKAVTKEEKTVASAGGDLVIPKSEITETAKFYPYKAGNTAMEVVAVKAKDGTIRTALNTCQVCNNSGKGYYKQQGEALVCQNCGNVFKMDQVEKIKGGCNPVPVTTDDKTDDGANITIPKAFLEQNKDLFKTWKRQ